MATALKAKKTLHDLQEIMVTPEMAALWLESTKFNNRNISDRLVEKIARDIKQGKWIVDGNPLKFDKDGHLIDGQHRCWGIIRSNMNVSTFVVHGIDSAAINIIDTGKSRSNSDILHFNGHVNTASLANACRISIGYKKNNGNLYEWAGGSSKLHCSSSEIVREAEDNKRLTNSLQDVISMKFVKKFMGTGTAAFCHSIFSTKDKLAADEFFYLLEKGVDLEEGNAVLALRNCLTLRDHLTSKLAKGGNYRCAYLVALIIKAWNFYRDGTFVKRLRFDGDKDTYPLPV